MKSKYLNARNRRKLSLLLSVTTMLAAVLMLGQLTFAPSMVQPVYAGSTLTPTPEPPPATNTPPPPTNTPPPPPTNTPVPPPPPTNTPEPPPSNSGGNNPPPPAQPSPTPTPEIPPEIPELGVGSTWQPLILTLSVMLISLGIAIAQVRYLLKSED